MGNGVTIRMNSPVVRPAGGRSKPRLGAHVKDSAPNTLMVLPIPSAAQGVLRPPCLLSGLAAHQHVQQTGRREVVDLSSFTRS